MNKPYIKPEAKKVEVDSQIIRMLSKPGFIEVFWEELAARRKEDPCISREAVFDSLNKKYCDVLGSFRYSSYDSFRRRINS